MTFGFDLDEQKVKFAKENAKIYQVDSEKLRVIKANFITSDIKKILLDEYDVSHVDVCFSSPPWGGVDYIQNLNYSLFHNIEPNGIQEWILKMLTLSKQIAIFVPRQIILSELPTLLAQISYESEFPLDRCSIELEEIYLNGKIIGIMMYYGGNIPKIKKSQEYDYIYEQLQKQPKPWLEENKKQQPFKYKSVIRFISEKVGMVDLLNLVIQSKQNIQDSLNAYEQFEKKILYDDLITEYELQKLKEQDVQSIEAKIQRNIAKKLKKQQLNQI